MFRLFQKKFPKEFAFFNDPYRGDELVALDTETSGLDPKKDEILSIAAVIIKNGSILTSRAFNVLVRPTKAVSQESIKVHRIRMCELNDALEPQEAVRQLLHFIQNRPLVGYYLDFDVTILSRYTKEYFGFLLPNKKIEVSGLYYDYKQKAIPQGFIDLKFATILKDLDIPQMSVHNALSDAVMSALIYLKLQRRKYGKSSSV